MSSITINHSCFINKSVVVYCLYRYNDFININGKTGDCMTERRNLRVGIDIGSTTIKLAVLNEAQELVYKNYERHFSEIGAALKENIQKLKETIDEAKFSFAMSGSAGMGLAQKLNLPFVQEVIACREAVKNFIPQTDTVVELGGEDAKITYFGAAPEQRMNGVCAGGTGSFIDHMAALLSTDAAGLNVLAAQGKQIYTIASRCGVFAKTDIQALMNDGASKADIALSIMQAVVNQTIGNLAQGRPITGHVAFLGGPLTFLSELKKRFIETLKLNADHHVPVTDGNYFVAMGAALSEDARKISIDELERTVKQAVEDKKNNRANTENGIKPLFADEKDYEVFRARHSRDKVKRGSLADYEGAVYVGIDAGSTTAKIAAVGENKELLYTSYGSNHGSPLKTVVAQMKDLYDALPAAAHIGAVYATGYGEAIVKAALHADGGEVETFAHLRAAEEFCPDVSFVMDIGGQDMKCFFVKDGNIGNITLNEACSAGCGSFIENFAQGLSMTAGEFAQKGVYSKDPVDLGTRCTVFMNSKVKQAQKDGASVADISAGIAMSVVKNALFKVMQLKNVEDLGEKIVVQGGTFYNDAVLRAIENILGKEVIRPDIAGLMGAYGAAVSALLSGVKKSTVLSKDALTNFTATAKSYRCNGCTNKCLITVQTFSDGGKYATGNRCERGVGGVKKKDSGLNVYSYKYKRVFDYAPLKDGRRGRLGLPRVLNMYEDYPFWFTFFTQLGYEVVLSDESSAKLYYKGMATVPSDSLCYPAKLAHGHIMNLIEKGVTKIFYPCEPYNMEFAEKEADNHFNCPIVASYAENIRGNMDILWEKNIVFYRPFLPLNDKKRLIERLHEELADENLSKSEIKAAVTAAYAELQHYRQDVAACGEEILRHIKETGQQAVLLIGRPYHADPEINHGIPEMIETFDIPVLSEDAVFHLPVNDSGLKIVNQWSYHARLYHAAKFAAARNNITVIQLSSFGCGLDALTVGEVKDITEHAGRIYTMIKLDEVSNLGAAKIRLRSLLAALKRKHTVVNQSPRIIERPRFTEECKKRHTVLVPQMAPIHFELLRAAVAKYGYNMVIPPMPDRAAIDLGLRYVNNDMCYPAIVVIGQLIAALKSGEYDENNTSIMLFQTCGACRATNYLSVLRNALKVAGFPQVPVFACYGMKDETDSFDLSRSMLVDVVKAAAYGDLLMNVKNRVEPYEITAGATQKLYEKWLARAAEDIEIGGFMSYRRNVKNIVADFENLPIDEKMIKPQVGIVGEILVKYHPVANNRIEKVLLEEGAEVVMPDFIDFFLYTAYDAVATRKLLDGTLKNEFFGKMFINLLEFIRRPVKKALKNSKRFRAPKSIYETAKLAEQFVSLGNMAGEGWFLTGEMVKLIEEGVKNVVCLQPFGCLPNHITGKGVMHALRTRYEGANLVAIDCDAGSSEVNQLNRVKLMLSVAKENLPQTAQNIDDEFGRKAVRRS